MVTKQLNQKLSPERIHSNDNMLYTYNKIQRPNTAWNIKRGKNRKMLAIIERMVLWNPNFIQIQISNILTKRKQTNSQKNNTKSRG